jgi:phosphatidylserine synthase
MARWKVGPVGVKDLFTLINLLSGVVAVHYVFAGSPRRAGYAVIAGYLLGDMLDGAVARATKTGNRFGGELDTVTDHFVHIVVPGLILYSVYRNGGHETLGIVAFGALVAAATVRHALFAAAKFDYPLCWCGLPRTVPGFVALSFALSSFRADHHAYLAGTILVCGLSVLTLLPIPYMTHRGARGMQGWVKVGVAIFLLSAPVAFLLTRDRLFDIFCFETTFYAVFGWTPVRAAERSGFYVEYRRWRRAVAA